ncbi:Alpha/Beta hydrolase protein [Gamsiella multidivaricata]|uniref:Alpha/Beta hydrolase protein n=1 Tax=Gamsiella multidivaricata TaxID=101098 RepID=UPI00221FF21A|nr:Alpha/Beta hydrolase protein [Gamsiella multidivaricata]KAI7816833.1 Alpha/Beta hydrolase protein [Gamsiella multidivaricata]
MATAVSKPPCVVCKTPSITRCSRCKVVHYCSETCQRRDWPTHKIACTPSTSSTATPTTKATPPTSSSSPPSSSTATENKQTSSTPTLPDPSKVLNAHPIESKTSPTSIRKTSPQASSTTLKFEYQPSPDGVDENLVLFFHGLGDKIKPNFVKLAQNMQLPQTATCCVQAPTPVPYLEQEGWQWYPSFNNLNGELLGPDSPERMLQVKQLVRPELIKLIRHCIDHCGFESRKISLFGFSQGGEIALDLAAFGGLNLRAVISVAGYLMEEAQNDEPAVKPSNTQVLVMQGDKDDLRTIQEAKARFKYLQKTFGKANVEQQIVEGMGHGMPASESGWRPLMEFFARVLDHRSTTMEGMSNVYEIK